MYEDSWQFKFWFNATYQDFFFNERKRNSLFGDCVHPSSYLRSSTGDWSDCWICVKFGIWTLYRKLSSVEFGWSHILRKGVSEFLSCFACFLACLGEILCKRYALTVFEELWVWWQSVRWNLYFTYRGKWNSALLSTFFFRFFFGGEILLQEMSTDIYRVSASFVKIGSMTATLHLRASVNPVVIPTLIFPFWWSSLNGSWHNPVAYL